jgi:hypothetical protein
MMKPYRVNFNKTFEDMYPYKFAQIAYVEFQNILEFSLKWKNLIASQVLQKLKGQICIYWAKGILKYTYIYEALEIYNI